MSQPVGVRLVFLLVIPALCLFEFTFRHSSHIVREHEPDLLLLHGAWLLTLMLWGATFLLYKTWRALDWPLVGGLFFCLLFYALAEHPTADACFPVFGVTLGKGAAFFIRTAKSKNSEVSHFLLGLVGLLAFSSWCHLNLSGNFYQGSRWMGLWDNPNIYGLLMGAGVALTVGLLAGMWNEACQMRKSTLDSSISFFKIYLLIGLFMMGTGLVLSYSRGAWLGTAIGLCYLANCYGNLKWRLVLPGIALLLLVVSFFWSGTPDSAPWYIKRADLGRPSAQHRVTAWRAGLEIMRDHPFGVGWDNAVNLYSKSYSPPDGGAAALTTNDYMMLGTELGIPALLCFGAYVALCFRPGPRPRPALPLLPAVASGEEINLSFITQLASLRAACLAGALVFVVTFWFDGGLFDLPTAALFWMLLEMGAALKIDGAKSQLAPTPPIASF